MIFCFNKNTVVDLSRIGSTETKALIMGVLVLKLSEFRQATSKGTNLPLHHVTIMEEAHNLLEENINRSRTGISKCSRKIS